jgi:hypothetical protein
MAVLARMPDILVMVTRVGAQRRSLRRRIADATPVTPKAACSCDAFGDHQQTKGREEGTAPGELAQPGAGWGRDR